MVLRCHTLCNTVDINSWNLSSRSIKKCWCTSVVKITQSGNSEGVTYASVSTEHKQLLLEYSQCYLRQTA